jgi:predicted small secreted protein
LEDSALVRIADAKMRQALNRRSDRYAKKKEAKAARMPLDGVWMLMASNLGHF